MDGGVGREGDDAIAPEYLVMWRIDSYMDTTP